MSLADDHGDRARNLRSCLDALTQQTLPRTAYRIVLIEQGRSPCVDERTRANADEYLFVYSPKPFNRSWVLNVAAWRTSGGVICTFDADLVAPAEFLERGLLAWRCGALAIKPFSEVLYMDHPSTWRLQQRIAWGEVIDVDAADYRGDRHVGSKGGCIWIDTALYRRMGGHDERFEGWGLEDREFWDRLQQHTSPVSLRGRVLHMYHERSFARRPEVYESAVLYSALQRGLLPLEQRVKGDLERFRRGEACERKTARHTPDDLDEDRTQEAIAVCRALPRTDRSTVGRALRVHGFAAQRVGNSLLASACLSAALMAPQDPRPSRLELGGVLERARRYDLAVQAYLLALRHTPSSTAPYRALARLFLQKRMPEVAIALCREALLLDLSNTAIVVELAEALLSRGDVGAASQAIDLAMRMNEGDCDVQLTAGRLRLLQGDPEAALLAFHRAAARLSQGGAASALAPNAERNERQAGNRPDAPPPADVRATQRCAVHAGIGEALLRLGRSTEAILELRKAVDAVSGDSGPLRLLVTALERANDTDDLVPALASLAKALADEGRGDEAALVYQEALVRKPDSLRSLFALGELHASRGRAAEALECFARGLAVNPGHTGLRAGLGRAAMAVGDLERGWTAFAAFDRTLNTRVSFEQPRWDGSTLSGQTVLVWADQALGDAIHCLRYLAIVRRCGGRVIFQCPARLVPLARRMHGIDMVVADHAPLPAFDLHTPLMQIPVVHPMCRWPVPPSPDDFTADPRLVRIWRDRLHRTARAASRATDRPPRFVGLSWAGHPEGVNRETRFTSLASFAPLAGLKGVEYVSLQMGPPAAELAAAPEGLSVIHLQDDSCSLDDTAALMENLDAIVTVDTAVAHLAGALRRPVLMTLPFVSDWRWMPAGETTPLYPTMEVIRQRFFGDWPGVMARVRARLAVRMLRGTPDDRSCALTMLDTR